jgi:hypothetical protein
MGELVTGPAVALGCDDKAKPCLQARLLSARIDRFMAEFDCTSCALRETGLRPTAAEVRSVLRSRALRQRFIDPKFCRDPSWDMLLELYATWLAGAPVTVSSLCLVAPSSATTAMRWIAALEAAGMVTRHLDTRDGRRVYLWLSDDVAAAMAGYFQALPDLKGV